MTGATGRRPVVAAPVAATAGLALLVLLLPALLPAAAGVGAGTPPASGGWTVATATAAERCDGVWVVVDARDLGGGVTTRCAPGSPSSGLDALDRAGLATTFVPRQPGFVCTIAGRPDPCNGAPADAYWSYWHASAGGSWTYATRGAASRVPAPGTVEGWRFGDGGAPPGIAPPAAPPAAPPPPGGDTDRAGSGSGTSGGDGGGTAGGSGASGSGSSGAGGGASNAGPAEGGDDQVASDPDRDRGADGAASDAATDGTRAVPDGAGSAATATDGADTGSQDRPPVDPDAPDRVGEPPFPEGDLRDPSDAATTGADGDADEADADDVATSSEDTDGPATDGADGEVRDLAADEVTVPGRSGGRTGAGLAVGGTLAAALGGAALWQRRRLSTDGGGP